MTRRLPVVVTPLAAAQIDDAEIWWRGHRPAAPGAIREELARAFDLIAAQPGVGAAARRVRLRGVRRVHLDRVRYHVYYRATAAAVEIVAFWHSSRGTGPTL